MSSFRAAFRNRRVSRTMGLLQPKILPLAICWGILVVYLSLPTKNYYWDGIGFALDIENATDLNAALLHPNHLLYTAAGYLDYRLTHALGLPLRALTILQINNSILSAACAYLLFDLLLLWLGSAYLSTVLTLAFSFAATWWKFSTDANSYVPSVFFLLLCFRLVIPSRSPKPALAAVTHAGAMLFHQLAVLFFPVVVVGLLQQTSSLPLRRRLSVMLQYSTITFLLTGAAYFGGFYWGQKEIGIHAFLSWITYHSPDASFSWNAWGNAFYTLRGHLRLFLGGRVRWVMQEWPRFTLAMIPILVVMLSALVYRLVRGGSKAGVSVRETLRIAPRDKPLAALLGVWFTSYLLFLFFWLPANTFYRLFYLPALVLLGGIFLARHEAFRGTARTYGTALLVGIMAVSNLTFDIYPNSQVESNPPLAFALQMSRVWSPGTRVYYSAFNTDDWTIRYFNPDTTWKRWNPPDLASLEAELQDVRRNAGNAWLDTTLLDQILSLPGGEEWLGKHALKNARMEQVDERRRFIFQRVGPA